MSDELKPEKLAHVAGEVLRIAKDSPDARDAGANVAASLKIVSQLVKNALLPIAAVNFGIRRAEEYFTTKFAGELGEHTAKIPDEDLVEPKASVVGPAMQSMAFALDEDELRQMYLALISTAMDGREPSGAHPAFVEILRQISSAELQMLGGLLSSPYLKPIVQFHLKMEGSMGYRIVRNHVFPAFNADTNEPLMDDRVAQFFDNWIRLRLVEVKYDQGLSDVTAYEWVTQRPEWAHHQSLLDADEELIVSKGYVRPTEWGLAFAKAVGMGVDK